MTVHLSGWQPHSKLFQLLPLCIFDRAKIKGSTFDLATD